MLGSLLKELAVKTGRHFFHRPSPTIGPGGSAEQKTETSPKPSGASEVNPSIQTSGIKLDLGCGKSKKPGFLGIDRRKFEGVDGATDLTRHKWLFEEPNLGGLQLQPASLDGHSGFILPDNSVAEVHCSHFLEHLEHNQSKPERVRFMNELWRVLVPGGRATIITPHWASTRATGDFTHADKPVSEMFYWYLDKRWRVEQAPDNDAQYHPDGYTCDFQWQLTYRLDPYFDDKGEEERSFAARWYKEACLDMHAILVARK
jgi:SAM-dependent methyltransferase